MSEDLLLCGDCHGMGKTNYFTVTRKGFHSAVLFGAAMCKRFAVVVKALNLRSNS
jgi:hypothetical protein